MTTPDPLTERPMTVLRPAEPSARAVAHVIDLVVALAAIALMRPLGFTWLVPALATGASGALLGGDSLGRRLAGVRVSGTYGAKASTVGVLLRDLALTSLPAVAVMAFAGPAAYVGVAVLLGANALAVTSREGVGLADALTQTRIGSDGL